jgi:membrane protease YdiL (CAAX protease family)
MAEGDCKPYMELRTVPGRTTVPQWVPWGVMPAAGIVVCWQLFQMTAGGLLGARPGALGPQLAAVAISDAATVALVWALVALWPGKRGRVSDLIGFRTLSWPAIRRSFKVVAAGTAAYAMVWVVLLAVLSRLGKSMPAQPLADLVRQEHSAALVVCAFIVGAVVAPITEEMIFRSLLYLPLRARFGVVPAALAVSALFALVHLYPWGVPQLVVLSLMFVGLFESTGTLWAPIAAHGLYNGLMMLVLRSMAAQ